MKTRVSLLYIFFVLLFLGVIGRLFYWQIVRSSELSAYAKSQYQDKKVVSAKRGSIYANDNTWLATNGESWNLYIDKTKIDLKYDELLNKIIPHFNDQKNEEDSLSEFVRIKDLISKESLVWVPVKKKIDVAKKKELEALGIKGLAFEEEDMRSYPEASAAAQLLGFVGKNKEGEDQGYFGLEGFYNLPLSGKAGFREREKDARGIPIYVGSGRDVPAVKGVDLITSIDKTIQLVIEKKLKDGIEKYGAKGGVAVVMNPYNGRILGMASYPSYDPRSYSSYSDELFRNPAVSDAFEPGSVFKVVVMASGIDAGVVTPDTKCDICLEPFKVDKYVIRTWDNKYRPDSTMTDVIVHSDNVGMTFVAQKLGSDKLYDYLHKFGIGDLSGIDLQGEANPGLRKRGTWNIVDLATAGFGQGVAVTPIQMLRATAVIANGGKLVTPQVVAKIVGEDWQVDIPPEVKKGVISEESAKKVTNMMVEAAKSGEAKWTSLTGFRVAGKTGTAQIPIEGHYDDKRTIGSFVGFAPADKPKFIMLVTLREPTSSPWASETAAPLWFSIARELFPYLGIQPES